jgi:DNA replication licensing factor MCM2
MVCRPRRTATIGCLVQLRGVVTRRTGVFPQLLQVEYECQKCGQLMGPFEQTGDVELKPQQCVACNSKGPFLVRAAGGEGGG